MPNYPSKALQEYALKSDLGGIGGAGGGTDGAMGPPGAAGATGPPWQPVQSATAPATTSAGTITTAALTVSRVAPAADIVNVVLQAGTIAAQQLAILNESAFSITFAVDSTSLVATGTGCVIAQQTHLTVIWNSVSGLWYPLYDGTIPIGSATYDVSVYDTGTYA